MLENIISTLTLSDYNSMYTLSFNIIRYILYAVATLKYLKLFQSVNYICIIAFLPNTLKAFFYSKIIFLFYSIIITFLLLIIHI